MRKMEGRKMKVGEVEGETQREERNTKTSEVSC